MDLMNSMPNRHVFVFELRGAMCFVWYFEVPVPYFLSLSLSLLHSFLSALSLQRSSIPVPCELNLLSFSLSILSYVPLPGALDNDFL